MRAVVVFKFFLVGKAVGGLACFGLLLNCIFKLNELI